MKKFWIFFLAAVLGVFCLIPGKAMAADIIAKGSCGDRVTWTLDSQWTLTISGKGEMKTYSRFYDAPWHKYSADIRKIVIESGITVVGGNAFYNCYAVSEVVLGDTVHTIREKAFESCSTLNKINFPASLTKIGTEAFMQCGLENLSLPATIRELGNGAFSECYSLTSVEIPDLPETLGYSIFKNCVRLKTVSLDGGAVGASMFAACAQLKQVDLGSSITAIRSGAFSGCSELVSLVVPDSVTSVENSAFSSCTNLAAVYLSKNLTAFGKSYDCPKGEIYFGGTREAWEALGGGILSKEMVAWPVHFQASADDFGQRETCSYIIHDCQICQKVIRYLIKSENSHSFADGVCTACGVADYWTYTLSDQGELTLNKYTGNLETLVVPGTIEGLPVRHIGWMAISDRKELVHVQISEGIERLDNHAFGDCRNLQTVSLPSTLRSIGDSAFDWSSLKQVVLPEGLEKIGKNVFSNCSALTEITIPSTLTSIGGSAFYRCDALEKVHITDLSAWLNISLEYANSNPLCYGGGLYLNGERLTHVTVPEGQTVIGRNAFACETITSIAIPESVKTIDTDAFSNCHGLEHVVYAGDSEGWAAITVKGGNETLTGLIVHYGLDTLETESTCAQSGTVTYTCLTCRQQLQQLHKPLLPHTWSQWKETTAPTVEADGEKRRECTVCGEAKTESIDNNPFTDVTRGDQFEDAILWAYYNGITKGTSATEFSPEKACTRKQIVTFLWRAAGEPEPASMENPFSDVTRGDQFEKAILWAYYEGITKGTSATAFSPERTCTRKQIVTFLWRYNASPEPVSMENPFTDVTRGDQFEKAILWAYYNGITKGTSATAFSPERPCTRKQIVTFLFRAKEKAEQMPTEPVEIIRAAYALAEGETLPYTAVLTGVIGKMEVYWGLSCDTVTLVMTVDGYEIRCVELAGKEVALLEEGDTVTVSGSLKKQDGAVQFIPGSLLLGLEKGYEGIPTDPGVIVRMAYQLERGESLPFEVTLTGVVSFIDDPYTETNGGPVFNIDVIGADRLSVYCHRAVGDVKNLRAGDVVTVTGTLGNYLGFISFLRGCTVVKD